MFDSIRRLFGFEATVPAAVVSNWLGTEISTSPIRLAPLAIAPSQDQQPWAAGFVNERGAISPQDAGGSLSFSVKAPSGWQHAAEAKLVEPTKPPSSKLEISQLRSSPAVVTHRLISEVGEIFQRCSAAVIDAKACLVIEYENSATQPVALGLSLRPLTAFGRGYAKVASIDSTAMAIGHSEDEMVALRFSTAPSASATATAELGDVLQNMPQPGVLDGADVRECRSGAAQVAAVWPLAQKSTLRFVFELEGPVSPQAAVPSISDIEKGWQRHFESGMQAQLEPDLGDVFSAAIYELLSCEPDDADLGSVVQALAVSGFLGYRKELLSRFEECEACDDLETLLCFAEWVRFAENPVELNDAYLVAIARAAHGFSQALEAIAVTPAGAGAGSSGEDSVRLELAEVFGAKIFSFARLVIAADGLEVLALMLEQSGQPGVAARLEEILGQLSVLSNGQINELQRTANSCAVEIIERSARGEQLRGSLAASERVRAGAELIIATRHLVVGTTSGLAKAPNALPEQWRGKPMEVFNAPIASVSAEVKPKLSYGLRWHGERSVLLWQFEGQQAVVQRSGAPGAAGVGDVAAGVAEAGGSGAGVAEAGGAEAGLQVRITAPGIDGAFSSTDSSGEHLLEAPLGWKRYDR